MDLIKQNLEIIYNLSRFKNYKDEDAIYEMIDFVVDTSNYKIDKLHEEYIRHLEFIIPFIEKMYAISDDLEWPFHARAIKEGTYPLEKIPTHLRNFAKFLYYAK